MSDHRYYEEAKAVERAMEEEDRQAYERRFGYSNSTETTRRQKEEADLYRYLEGPDQ